MLTVAVTGHEVAETDADERDGTVVGSLPVRPLLDLHEDGTRHEHEQPGAEHRDQQDAVHRTASEESVQKTFTKRIPRMSGLSGLSLWNAQAKFRKIWNDLNEKALGWSFIGL